MKHSINELAQITFERLNSSNIDQCARQVWLELQKNKKYSRLDDLINKIRKLTTEKESKTIVQVFSAQELSEEEKHSVENKLEKKLSGKILPIYRTDKSILGGIKVKIEDEILDLSWKGKLQLIQAKLEGNYE